VLDITFAITAIDLPGNFIVSATTPPAMVIFVPSIAGPDPANPIFSPVTDIDPTTIFVNGVAIPTATVVADPVDRNSDGIADALVFIPDRTVLNLTAATTTLTITGQTIDDLTFSGSAAITVVGAGGGGTPAPAVSIPLDVNLLFPPPNASVPPFGERLIPQRQVLSKLRWKPLPVRRAYRQFLPTNGFTRRFVGFFHPETLDHLDNPGGREDGSQYGVSTLGRNTFTRGRFKVGQIRFPRIDHGQPTIPPT